MRFPLRLALALALAVLLTSPALAGPRLSGLHGDGLSQAQVVAAGARAMSKAEAQAFIDSHNGRLYGDIGPWRDSLRLFNDGTLKGECHGDFGSPVPGAGSWSLDEDGTLHLRVNWRYGDKQNSSGKLYLHQGYAYQMDGSDPNRSWLYRFKQ